MALLTDEQKQNFDTTFIAQYDQNGDNTLLNPQPLQLDDEGYLKVNVQTGAINTPMFAFKDNGQTYPVKCNDNGAIDAGAMNFSLIVQTGGQYALAGEYTTFEDARAGIEDLRNQLLEHIYTTLGKKRIYNYAENIVIHDGKFNVFVSCYYSN